MSLREEHSETRQGKTADLRPPGRHPRFTVHGSRPEDFKAIERISRETYPGDYPWTERYLSRHLEIFPEGQLVVEETEHGRVVGMAASLIITWDEYDRHGSYDEFTDHGMFTNHNPRGRTLYGAEVIVDPKMRGQGVGSRLYEARRDLVRRLGLLRIRAGARLPGYARYAEEMVIEDYVREVIRGNLYDPTLTFQLNRDFHVLAIVPGYFKRDLKSRNFAALIEWINQEVATAEDFARVRIFK